MVVSGATVFVLLSGAYFYGFSVGLVPEIRGLNLHDHLTVSDYTTTAIQTFSNPLVLIAVFLLARCLLLLDEGVEHEANADPNSSFRFLVCAFVRRARSIIDRVKKFLIALAVIIASLVVAALISCSSIVTCDFFNAFDASFVLSVLAMSVVLYFVPYFLLVNLLTSVRIGSDGTLDISRRKKLMSTMVGIGYVCFLFSFLGWILLSEIPDFVEPVVIFFFGAFVFFWIPVIDRSYGDVPIYSLFSDRLRSFLTLVPMILPWYVAFGFVDAHRLKHDTNTPYIVKTENLGNLKVKWYRTFDKWTLAACASESTYHVWIPSTEIWQLSLIEGLATSDVSGTNSVDLNGDPGLEPRLVGGHSGKPDGLC